MQKIIPHIWFSTEAKEATEFYTSLFPHSKIDHLTRITDTPSGDCDMVSFTLAGQKFMAISAGPYFTLNPAISLFVVCESEEEIQTLWNKLSEGGKVLMPCNTYPWAKKYGWLQDKYGLSWQLSLSTLHQMVQKITPSLMFTKGMSGKVKEAVEMYAGIFTDSKIEMMVPYEKGEGDTEGFIKHARYSLLGYHFTAMDSSGPHDFANEAISFVIPCDTQEEIDHYSDKLSAHPEAEQCGWVKDKYGVSWQITPSIMNDMMTSDNKEGMMRVTQAFLKMKRFNIAEIQKAWEG